MASSLPKFANRFRDLFATVEASGGMLRYFPMIENCNKKVNKAVL